MGDTNNLLDGASVLVIEDDEMQLMAMQMLLETWGCRVAGAGSAGEAEGHLAEAAAPPRVIISDFRLPGNVSGLDLVETLRSRAGRVIPAVLQTGDTDPALADAARQKGYVLLHKPYHPDQLRGILAELLSA